MPQMLVNNILGLWWSPRAVRTVTPAVMTGIVVGLQLIVDVGTRRRR